MNAIRHIILATSNSNKVREYAALLMALGITVHTVKSLEWEEIEVEETGSTFAENAKLKAKAYAKAYGKLIAERFGDEAIFLAEDSGLIVNALPEVAGLHSNRWHSGTDADRNAELLRRLPLDGDRNASYVAAICLCDKNGTVVWEYEAICFGWIVTEPVGENGFAYDSLFASLASDRLTFGQLTAEEKNRISHRGLVMRSLLTFLRSQ